MQIPLKIGSNLYYQLKRGGKTIHIDNIDE